MELEYQEFTIGVTFNSRSFWERKPNDWVTCNEDVVNQFPPAPELV